MKEVHCLFDGRMTHKDGALRILLLARYITEWARDIYSLMIRHQLKLLTDPHGDNASLHGGSNATTLREYWKDRLPIAQLPSESVSHHSLADLSTSLDTPFGWVRSIYDIENRFCGLLLDSSTVNTFVHSLLDRSEGAKPMYSLTQPGGSRRVKRTKAETKTIFHQLPWHIIQLLKKPQEQADYRCSTSEYTLNYLEELWTGEKRSRMPSSQESSNLWATITVTFYVSHEWRLVRELSYVAVSKPALEQIGQLYGGNMPSIQPPAEIAAEPLEMLTIQLKAASAEHNLAAAISRSSVSLPLAVLASGTGNNSGAPSTANSMTETGDAFERTSDWRTHEIVLYTKDDDTFHENEHSKSYLRLSSQPIVQAQDESPNSWPLRVQNLTQNGHGAVVVHGKVSNMTRFKKKFGRHDIPNQCVFVKRQSEEHVSKILQDSVVGWTIYRTLRREWKDLAAPNSRESHGEKSFGSLEFDLQVYVSIIKWMSELGYPLRPDVPLPPGVDLESIAYQDDYRVVNLPRDYARGWRHQIEGRIISRQKENKAQRAQEEKFCISEKDFSPDDLVALSPELSPFGMSFLNSWITRSGRPRVEIGLTEDWDEEAE